MDQGLITYFLSTKSSVALVLKIRTMSRVVSVGGEGGYVVTMTCPVNSYKDNFVAAARTLATYSTNLYQVSDKHWALFQALGYGSQHSRQDTCPQRAH